MLLGVGLVRQGISLNVEMEERKGSERALRIMAWASGPQGHVSGVRAMKEGILASLTMTHVGNLFPEFRAHERGLSWCWLVDE